jgi:hypothetical protein
MLRSRHVFHDLMAYSCTFEHCDHGPFESRTAWAAHEQRHHLRSWKCPICHDNFEMQALAARHVAIAHTSIAKTLVDELVIAASPKVKRVPISQCPLCNDHHSEKSVLLQPTGFTSQARGQDGRSTHDNLVTVALYHRHMSHHMEQLALFAVPAVADDEEDGDTSDQTFQHTMDEGFMGYKPGAPIDTADADHTRSSGDVAQETRLGCLFRFLGCTRTFVKNDGEWYEHSKTHFREQSPPNHLRCPYSFCAWTVSGIEAWTERWEHLQGAHDVMNSGEDLCEKRDGQLYEHLWKVRVINSAQLLELRRSGKIRPLSVASAVSRPSSEARSRSTSQHGEAPSALLLQSNEPVSDTDDEDYDEDDQHEPKYCYCLRGSYGESILKYRAHKSSTEAMWNLYGFLVSQYCICTANVSYQHNGRHCCRPHYPDNAKFQECSFGNRS